MNTWRLLKLQTHNAFMNMAIDESILQAQIKSLVPSTIRFYGWNPSAVSIGRFQDIAKEVQLDNCRIQGVDVVRRITGGGTVYHDAFDEITYSVIAQKNDLGTEDIHEIYSKICSGLGHAIKTLGVDANFNEGSEKACPNLTIRGKKMSGSAQAHKKGVVLQHGTLLLKVDLEKMFTFLRVTWAKTPRQVAEVAKGKITSLVDELKRETSVEEVGEALKEGFEKTFNMYLEAGELTPFENELTERLYRQKYSAEIWNTLGKCNML